jgi:crotonobetainyl-CoA:carnitine CoA-transferase CaiB-like acyl-CoA transferase
MTPERPPLDGIRVIEVGNFMAVPFCGMQLADLGADVVKVENPRRRRLDARNGAVCRRRERELFALEPQQTQPCAGPQVDPRCAALPPLGVACADVVIENLRPGTMKRLGLDYPALADDAPGLIYVAATGFGQDGPYASWPGLDIIAQGMSGTHEHHG